MYNKTHFQQILVISPWFCQIGPYSLYSADDNLLSNSIKYGLNENLVHLYMYKGEGLFSWVMATYCWACHPGDHYWDY